MFNAKINWIDVGALKATSSLYDIPAASTPDMTKLLALATSLHSYSRAGVLTYALLQWTEGEMTTPLAAAVGSNCDKAQINYKWIDAGGSQQFGTLWIPNPDPTIFELITGVGYRLTAAAKALLETSLSTASGLTISIVEGKPEYKESDAGIGGKNDSCLQFIDEAGNYSYMAFPLASSSALLIALGDAFNTDSITQSVLDRSFFLAKTEASPAIAAATGAWDCVETRAYVKMQYIAGGKKRYQTIMIPAPLATNLEQNVGQRGWNFTKAVGEGIALALTSFYGAGNRTLTYVGSRVDVKQLQNQ